VLRVLHGREPVGSPLAEPVPGEHEPLPPADLSDGARQVWDELAPDLRRCGLLTFWDVPVFVAFCAAVAQHREALRLVDQQGLMVASARLKDRDVPNPLIGVANRAADLALKCSARFGLTPTDRAEHGALRYLGCSQALAIADCPRARLRSPTVTCRHVPTAGTAARSGYLS
jgi:P27 family predicted phage terminase small subunit